MHIYLDKLKKKKKEENRHSTIRSFVFVNFVIAGSLVVSNLSNKLRWVRWCETNEEAYAMPIAHCNLRTDEIHGVKHAIK